MSIVGVLCGRVLPTIVVGAALFLGWLSADRDAMGITFAFLGPLLDGGRLPPLLVDHGRMDGAPAPPAEMTPAPPPGGEARLRLRGGSSDMPMSGLGMCCRASAYDHVLVRRTTLWYLLQGGRHIDTAHVYRNHRAVGLGIKDAMERGVPRSEIFLVTKVFPGYYGYQTTLDLVPTFLEELGVDYIDTVLMHAPKMPLIRNDCHRRGVSDAECRRETWRALSELRARGLVRNVGVSNFGVDHLREIEAVEGGAPIANNQIQFNVFVPERQHDVYRYCVENGIAVTAYYPLGGALEKKKASESALIRELSAKYGKSTYQLLMRWVIEKGAAIIPGTGNPKHMKDNLDVYSWSIEEEDMARMEQLRNSKEAEKMTFIDLKIFS